jgi:carbamoyltransferase
VYILGINAYHGDSSACILHDGRLIAATEEERFRRIKHWAGFPSESIRFCLKEAGVGLADVDHITISRDPRVNFWPKVMHVLKNPLQCTAIAGRLWNLKKLASLGEQFRHEFGVDGREIEKKVVYVEHHLSHAASAFFASPYEKSAILSIDGFGDFASTMLAYGQGNQIVVIDKVYFPHSIGVFYTAFTQYLGFPHYGDEYKVMGLAPYGKPVYLEELEKIVQLQRDGLFKLDMKYFIHESQGVSMTWNDGEPRVGRIFSNELEKKFGPARKNGEPLTQQHKDMAASVQAVCEKAVFNALNYLRRITGSENICIAGGVAQNSVANGKIGKRTSFKQSYIPMAGHDSGTAIGSALYLYHGLLGHPRGAPIVSAYTGSYFTNEQIEEVLRGQSISYERIDDEQKLYAVVVDRLISAGVVGWFQGRAEFGPRALGARSILCDPSRQDAKELINSKIKRRESFRPFAPSILEEYVDEYFEVNERALFMEKVLPVRKNKRAMIPAVTHVDGTGRLQTVSRAVTPRYYGLIEAFRKTTGVPLLLNTSFNENEPIVNSPQEALDCFLRTQMDMLVLENCVIRR